MDSYEQVREAARDLHRAVVAAGANPQIPRTLLDHALVHLKLELVWLASDDPALKGAIAIFDEQTGAICCSQEGSEAAKLELIAHEIAHAVIHSSTCSCTPADIDGSRAEEATPIGLQRVEDYGGKERREVQANVFAREFLFPKHLARQLFLEDGLGASDIAGRLGLSKDLTRQQLLDVLLLPDFVPACTKVSPKIVRDDSQLVAAAHRGSPFQLQAGPGTGKTRTLVQRVLGQLDEGVDPASMLVLTFSNRAAGELSERIGITAPVASRQIWIGTFHAFGLDLVRRYHDQLGLPADPKLMDRSDAIEFLEEILPILPLKHYRNLWDPTLVLRDILQAISKAKDELVDAAQYQVLAERMRAVATVADQIQAAEKVLEISSIYAVYETQLKKLGAVDFGDLVMLPALLLERDVSARQTLALRHRHILIDEYQDVNRASARLLKSLAGNGKNLWVVGDSRQSIYRFRGASSTNMSLFAQDYPGAIAQQLSVNFRSSDEIVGTLVQLAPHMLSSSAMLPLSFSSARGASGHQPQIHSYETPAEEINGIVQGVLELRTKGVCFRDQAVICRTNARLNEIANALEAGGIPVLHLGSFFERDEIRNLLSLMSLAIDPYGDGFARVGAMPRHEIPLQDVRRITQILRQEPHPAACKLNTILAETSISPKGLSGLTKLADDLRDMSKNITPWEFLTTYLLDRVDDIRALARSANITDALKAAALWQFVNFARDIGPRKGSLPIHRLLERVRKLVLLAEERDLRQVPDAALHLDAVRLLTVHGSKGLEFEAVHVPGMTVSSFPSSFRGPRCPSPEGIIETFGGNPTDPHHDHEEEEQCLFFVAVSRAKVHCRLTLARKQANGRNRTSSEFLNWLPSTAVRTTNKAAGIQSMVPAGLPIPIEWPEEWRITDANLMTYDGCPRRYFYTHVLGLGGRNKVTAFGQTHECIYTLMQWLSIERASNVIEPEQIREKFGEIWDEKGPSDHAFVREYRSLAGELVETLIRLGTNRVFQQAEQLSVILPEGPVSVSPREVAVHSDGKPVLCIHRTGRKRSDEYERLDYALYHLAARARYGDAYHLETFFLTSGDLESPQVSPRRIAAAETKSSTILQEIRAGNFPPESDQTRCPRCPHFFICSATPLGQLSLAD